MRTRRFPSGELVNRLKTIEFVFDGKKLKAYDGDTVGSALAAEGIQVVSRSFKYHRPRGLMCVSGQCPNCLVNINGSPNARACLTKVQANMAVESQNRWFSLQFDILSILDKFKWILPVGFYYKSFHKPKLVWKLVRPILRKLGGLGTVNTKAVNIPIKYHRSLFTGAGVVGAGTSGLSAALAAAEAGIEVTLIDKLEYLGGANKDKNLNLLIEKVLNHKLITTLLNSPVFGIYPGKLITIDSEVEMIKLRCKQIVIATGSHEVPMSFENNDLPGIMLANGAIKLLRLYGVLPGSDAVIFTERDTGYVDALELKEAGIRVKAVVDSRNEIDSQINMRLAQHEIPVFTGVRCVKAIGHDAVSTISFRHQDEWFYVDCDLVCMSGRLQPASQLALQVGCATKFDRGLNTLIPTDPPQSIYLTGGLIGITDKLSSAKHGKATGKAAAVNERSIPPYSKTAVSAECGTFEKGCNNKEFICICEDVTSKDLQQAIGEGFGDIQILKRYSTVTMGPCQGKMCLSNFLNISSEKTGIPQSQLGPTTQRPPVEPTTLGTLAGPGFIPVKRSPLHNKHVELGAKMLEVGGWMRPYSYVHPDAEVSSVRNNVGIIDVSTLGKLDVRGPDASKLLDFVYVNKISNLKIGRVRYGVMCLENGVILDDGTVTKLSDHRFFITTTTTNIEVIESWFKWWLASDVKLDVKIANVTSEFASINIAGPNAMPILQNLTSSDIRSSELPYMCAQQAYISGIPTIILRIGFVGEMGWELHFPSMYAEFIWNSLSVNDVQPFGVEAQRILRLEKGHIIVNQDTDSLTTPLEIGMSQVLRSNKLDFIGKHAIHQESMRGIKRRSIGFIMKGSAPTPNDGCAIVHNGLPIGRVTSARRSPTNQKPFGLAILPENFCIDGQEISVLIKNDLFPATVSIKPIYDPEGHRLKA